jgi:hypothetical protein
MDMLLVRQFHGQKGTNGELFIKGKKFCNTIELPWRDNQRRISCIPEGRYRVVKRYTPKFGWHCLLLDVPDRSLILIHAFNDALKESKGCIAPVTWIDGPGLGSTSRPMLKKLLAELAPALDHLKPVFITIKNSKDGIDIKKGAKADTKVL